MVAILEAEWMRATIRFFVNGKRKEVFTVPDAAVWSDKFQSFLDKHPEILTERHMIEIEFLDEPDPRERFLRFGTDPNGMTFFSLSPW
jgi:hypothetical protein